MTARETLLWEVFGLDLDTAAEIDAKLFKLITENGMTHETVKSIIERYNGNELAYAMCQYGKIYCVMSDSVGDFDPLAAEVRLYLSLSFALEEKEIAKVLKSRYSYVANRLTEKTAEQDPQFF